MTDRRSRRREEIELPGMLERLTAPPRRASLPGLAWAWRKELLLLGTATVLFTAVAGTFGIVWALAGLSATLGVLSPPWSERLTAFGWQLITPHLLRAGLYQARIQNRSGRRPMIRRITSEPFGQRVTLWCPPGTCAEDLYAARAILRAACRAADVRIIRDRRRSHIVTVEVVRHRDDAGGTGDDHRAAA